MPVVDLSGGTSDVAENLGVSKAQVNGMLVEGNGIDKAYDSGAGTVTLSVEDLPDGATVLSDADLDDTVASQAGLTAHAADTTSIHGIANTAALLTTVAVPTNITATGTASGTTFLRGDGAWAVPAGGGGGSGDLIAANNLSDVASVPTARTNLGLAIGTNVQAYSATLAATTASFLTADETKLDLIEAGAEVNVVDSVNGAVGVVVLGYADVGAEASGAAAAALAGHEADTTSVHGIANTANLLKTSDIGVTVQAFGGGTSGALLATNNLSDIPNKPQARLNLGVSSGSSGLPAAAGAVDDYSTAAAVVLATGSTATGWSSANTQVAFAYDATNTAVKVVLRVGYVVNAALTAKAWFTPTVPLNVTGRSVLTFEMKFVLSTNEDPTRWFEFVATEGASLTGTAAVAGFAGNNEDQWFTVVIPLDDINTVTSVGMRTIGVSPSLSDQLSIWFRNVHLAPMSQVQSAQEDGVTPLVFEGDTVGVPGAWAAPTHKPRADFRFAHAVHPGLHGKRDLREWELDEDGGTDVTDDLARIIKSLDDGSTLLFPADGKFLVHGSIRHRDLKGITVDMNGSMIFETQYRSLIPGGQSLDFIRMKDCRSVKYVNGMIVGYRAGDNGSSFSPGTELTPYLTTIAGTPTSSGTAKLLDAQDEAIRFQPHRGPNDLSWLARHYDVDTNQMVNKMSVILSDNTQVPGDCRVRITDLDGYVIAERTLTLTSTPTEYTLQGEPHNLARLVRLEVAKMTATSNTITVSTIKVWGKIAYNGDAEYASGISILEGCWDTEIDNFWVEGASGYGYNVQGKAINDAVGTRMRHTYSRGCHTQGHTVNFGTDTAIIDSGSFEAGRSAFDIEPYTETWWVNKIRVENFHARNPINYGIGAGNWSRITDIDIINLTVENAGVGAFAGGGRGGNIRGIHVLSGSRNINFMGQNLHVDEMVSQYAPSFPASTSIQNGITYTSGGNYMGSGLVRRDSLIATDSPEFTEGNVIGPGSAPSITGGAVTAGGAGGTGAAKMNGRPILFGWSPGTHQQRMPNTYKGVAVDGAWFPYGLPGDEGVVSTLGISSTTTPARNMTGIGVPVTLAATTVAVAFASKGSLAQFLADVNCTSTTQTGGTLVPATAYYYSFATRPHWRGGSKAAFQQKTVTISTGHNAAQLGLKNWQDLTNGYHLAGATIYRGTVGTTGPWTHRYDIAPLSPFASVSGAVRSFHDLGTTLVWNAVANDREWGYPNMTTLGVVATATVGSWSTIVDETGYEPDTSYAIQVTPSWLTTVQVTAKAKSGFTINFGTAAPAGATVDWFLVR